jgi:hypothetical protein
MTGRGGTHESGKLCFKLTAARDESAPPNEWPVVAIEKPGCSFSCTATMAVTCTTTEFQLCVSDIEVSVDSVAPRKDCLRNEEPAVHAGAG